MDSIRKAFGGKKRREALSMHKIDASSLDVTYITPRIILAGRPTERATDIDDRRNNISQLTAWLEQRHGDNWTVFNLSRKTRTDLAYNRLKNSIQEFHPLGRLDVIDDIPMVGQVYRFIYTLHFLLAWNTATVAVVVCNTGLLRSSFFVAAYLCYSGVYGSMQLALENISDMRLGDPMALFQMFTPTWRMLLREMDGSHFLHSNPTLPRIVCVSHVAISLPTLRDHIFSRCVQSYDFDSLDDISHFEGLYISQYPIVQIYSGAKVVWDSVRDGIFDETVRWEGDNLILSLDTFIIPGHEPVISEEGGLVMCGDYQLWIILPELVPRGISQWSRRGDSRDMQEYLQMLHSPNVHTSNANSLPTLTNGGAAIKGRLKPRRIVARTVFHTSMLDPTNGVFTVPGDDCDIYRNSLASFSTLSVSFVFSPLLDNSQAQYNLERILKRYFINLQGMPALQQGSCDWSSHHYVFPSSQLLQSLRKEGFDETAIVCALQRANNEPGRTREILDCDSFREIFKEDKAERDKQLLRETLSMDEIASVLAARENIVVRKRGVQFGDLDFSALLEAARLGKLKEDGKGGGGSGSGKGKGRGRGKGKKKKGGSSDDSDSSDSDKDFESDGSGSEGSGSEEDEDGKENTDLDDFIGKNAQGALFANMGDAKDSPEDEEEEVEEEQEDGGPYLMKEHPVFGAWFKALADGKPKAELVQELTEQQWNLALLDVPPDNEVPDIPAMTVNMKDWVVFSKYTKMSAVGLPRPIVEHKMIQDGFNPELLDADPNNVVSALLISPPKKGKGSNKPSLIRRRLHWVPIKCKIEGTIWAGPPADLLAAAKVFIQDEKEFERLFIQNPEDLKKKAKKNDNIVQLIDAKRAMNAGIALAKMKIPHDGIAACLSSMTSKSGKYFLSGPEVTNLVSLAPTDEEIRIVKNYKGDKKRLGPVEKFFLSVADIPQCKGRAQGLYYQYMFDERMRETRHRIRLFTSALDQIKNASRFQRLLKAVLVLGNHMNGATKKNVVKAFTIASLHQLHQTRTFSEDRMTVLEYFIKLLKKMDPDLLRVSSDFGDMSTLANAKRLSLDILSEDMKILREGLTNLEAVMKEAAQTDGMANTMSGGGGGAVYVDEAVEVERKDGDSSEEDDAQGEDTSGSPNKTKKPKKKYKKVKRRVEPLPHFASLAQEELTTLQSEFEAADSGFAFLRNVWFHEDQECGPDDMMGNIHLFLQTFDNMLKSIIERRKKAKDAKRRAKEMKKRQKALEKAKKKAANRRRAKDSDSDDDSDDDDDDDSDTSGSEESSSEDESSEESSESEDSESEDSDDDSDDELDLSKPVTQRPGWTDVQGDGGDSSSESEDEAPRGGGAGGSGGMGGLLAAIRSRGAEGSGSQSGTPGSASKPGVGASTPGSAKSTSSAATTSSDPRGGLLAAIQARRKDPGGTPAGGGGGSASSAATDGTPASKKSTPAAKEESSSEESTGGGGDPRNSLLAAIQKRRIE